MQYTIKIYSYPVLFLQDILLFDLTFLKLIHEIIIIWLYEENTNEKL